MKKNIFSLILFLLSLVILSLTFLLYTQRNTSLPEKTADKDYLKYLTVSDGYQLSIFAKLPGNPRDLVFSPGGTMLTSFPEQGKILAIPDKDKNGVYDTIHEVLVGLVNPHGIAFYDNKLYVAEFDRIIRYDWDEQTYQAKNAKNIVTLPNNRGHINRSIAFNKNGQLFVSIGSSCNSCIEQDQRLGTVLITDKDGNNPRIYASGLRNAAFLATHPLTQELWATEMGQDLLGDNLPPDEVNIIHEGKHYGWPYCYGKNLHNDVFDPDNNYSCDKTIPSTFDIPAHSAPLGLLFITSPQFPDNWQNDLFVAYHGSWDRKTLVGYKIVHMKVENNTITGESDFITGFIPANAKFRKENYGRPVDMAFDIDGALYLSDDSRQYIYKVVKK